MDLTSLKIIKELCQRYAIRTAKIRGQNFLISQNVVDKVIRAADLKKNDVVLEIGPGLGTITQELARRVKKVLAVEIDKKLVRVLGKILADFENVEIVHGDILKFQPTTYNLEPKTYKIVASLPFNITSLVLKKFLSEQPKPNLMVLILQKEVAEKIVARPPKMSLLAVSVQFYGNPKIVARISKGNFWPQPGVDSAIVKITLTGPTSRKFEDRFFKIVKAGFSSPRKKLVNNLTLIKKEELLQIFQKLGLKPNVRAQELSVENWINLTKLVIHRLTIL
jgi:16S rRNA (adenine1518-N6/adenine1519-N6)-dimethyltransferase